MPDETATTWLTPQAHEKLADEFEELTTVGRRHIEERIAEARSHGDLRENADYDAAKNEQGMMEARIRPVKHWLDTAEVLEAGAGWAAIRIRASRATSHLMAPSIADFSPCFSKICARGGCPHRLCGLAIPVAW